MNKRSQTSTAEFGVDATKMVEKKRPSDGKQAGGWWRSDTKVNESSQRTGCLVGWWR